MNNIIKKWVIVVSLIAAAVAFYSDISYAGAQNENFIRAQESVKEGDYKDAIKEFKLALKKMPASGEIYLHLGRAYNKVGEYELAQRHLTKAAESGIKEEDIVLDMGYSLRRLGYYEEAVGQYKSALKYKEIEGKAYIGLGYCNLKLKNYDEANRNLDKAMDLDGSVAAKAKLYKGIIKYEQGNYDEALLDLEVSLAGYEDYETKASAKNYISAVKKIKRGERNYLFVASLSLLFDDNVMTLNDSEVLSVSDKDDYGAVGYVRGIYHPIKNDVTTLFLGYMFYQKLYADLSDYNLQNHHALFNYTTGFGDFGAFLLRYDYNYYFLDGDRYFQKSNLKPALRINETKNAYLDINLTAGNKDYFSEKALSSNNFGGGLKQTLESKSGMSLYLLLDYNKEDTKDKDYEYTGLNLGLGFSHKCTKSTSVDLDAGYFMKDYDNTHSIFFVKRDDDVITALFRIKKEISSSLSTSLRYDYTVNDSNIDYYDYTRNVVSLEVKYLY
jgi:Tfp pilus assembly protein PilF